MAYSRSDFEFITDEDWKTANDCKRDPIEDLINRNSIGEKRYISVVANYSLKVNEHITESILNDELRIVIIGKTGEGKSATANTILGKKVFKDDFTSKSVTSKSKCETVLVNGRKVSVMDTPGLLDTERSDVDVLAEVARVMKVFSQGVHAFIYVMSIGNPRFTQEDLKTLNEIEVGLFGGHFKTFTLLVYTRAETELTETSLDKFYQAQRQRADSDITLFLDQLEPNIVAVNNKTPVLKERERNQNVILGMIDRLRLENAQDVYTTTMFNKAVEEKEELERKGKTKGWSPEVMDAVDLAIAADPDVGKRTGELDARVNDHLMRRLEEKEFRLLNLEEELKRQAMAIRRQSLEHEYETRLRIEQEAKGRAEAEERKRREENERVESLQREIRELKTLLHSKETTSQVQEIRKEHDGILDKIGGFIFEGAKKVVGWLKKLF
ncbi:GTPase IMAP family member 4 [Holothuria leucospilota]|uniref:GTPase IMAP family member 4 n=1 Tax=Holothuria leucospilota TaxID=206669 RepID=A0A9Q1BN30_HOLLE|nr:GTPase IMAP family member 4 [Holothuria leucospilota]